MLSRVAERIYWAARYLERVENTARLVNVYTSLLMDLPKDIDISWFNLVMLNSSIEDYENRYTVRDERNVVKFLLADDTNPNSMLSSLSYVRENLRTTRDVMPEGVWELINELSLFASQDIQQGLNRSKRHEFLQQIINHCQLIQGHLSTTMPQDAAWEMWCLGGNLERADMATRLLDAGATAVADSNELGDDISQRRVHLTVWANVLHSSSAHHAYRRAVSAGIKGRKVVDFLLRDERFPRSVAFCLASMSNSVRRLPKSRTVIMALNKISTTTAHKPELSNLSTDLRDYLNDLQLYIANLHSLFSETWFALD